MLNHDNAETAERIKTTTLKTLNSLIPCSEGCANWIAVAKIPRCCIFIAPFCSRLCCMFCLLCLRFWLPHAILLAFLSASDRAFLLLLFLRTFILHCVKLRKKTRLSHFSFSQKNVSTSTPKDQKETTNRTPLQLNTYSDIHSKRNADDNFFTWTAESRTVSSKNPAFFVDK